LSEDDFIAVRASVTGYMQTYYELEELIYD